MCVSDVRWEQVSRQKKARKEAKEAEALKSEILAKHSKKKGGGGGGGGGEMDLFALIKGNQVRTVAAPIATIATRGSRTLSSAPVSRAQAPPPTIRRLACSFGCVVRWCLCLHLHLLASRRYTRV